MSNGKVDSNQEHQIQIIKIQAQRPEINEVAGVFWPVSSNPDLMARVLRSCRPCLSFGEIRRRGYGLESRNRLVAWVWISVLSSGEVRLEFLGGIS